MNPEEGRIDREEAQKRAAEKPKQKTEVKKKQ